MDELPSRTWPVYLRIGIGNEIKSLGRIHEVILLFLSFTYKIILTLFFYQTAKHIAASSSVLYTISISP